MLRKFSKKSKQAPEDDTSWVVEGIVAYLHSPACTSPILNFVEEHCGSFTNSDENSFEHTEIYERYKKLLENVLGGYMGELGITEKQFSEACSVHNGEIVLPDSKFEYIWAGDDFLLFKRLMIKHNAELQREALTMLQQGQSADNSILDNASATTITQEDVEDLTKKLKPSKRSSNLAEQRKLQQQENYDMQLAIQFSKLEMERLNALVDEEKRLLEQAIRLSLDLACPPVPKSDPCVPASSSKPSSSSAASNMLTKPVAVPSSIHLPEGFSNAYLDSPPSYTAPPEKLSDVPSPRANKANESFKKTVEKQPKHSLPPLKTQTEVSSSEAASAWLDRAMKEITKSPANGDHEREGGNRKLDEIDPQELANRKAYLQKQRDKLLAIKRKEREKELQEYIEKKAVEVNQELPVRIDPEEQRRLASRRAVAERLKREVINKK